MPATKHPFDPSRVNYRIVIALVISLLLHLALLSKFGFPSQSRQTHSSTLQVRLNPQLPLTANKIVATPAVPVKQQPAATEPVKEEPSVQKNVQSAPEPLAAEQPIAQRSETPNLESVESLVEPVAENKQTAEEPTLALEGTGVPPRWVDIEFEIYTGQDRKLIGKGLHHFESDNANNYQLSFKQINEPEISSLSNIQPGDDWILNITGGIYRSGLGPATFKIQGTLSAQLLLNASKGSVPPHVQSGRFPDAILDRQSLIYEFMFLPIHSRGEIILTDGVKITTFSYRMGKSDSIEIGSLGKLNALQLILTTSKSSEMIEVWLAPDFRYLVVKQRHTTSDGLITEQLATSINMK